jgi:hypothetical protein
MKTRLVLSLAATAVLSITACNKSSESMEVEAAPESLVEQSPSAPAPPVNESKPIVAEKAPAAAEPNHFAPDGVFFLMAKASVETDSGIIGVPAGSRVIKSADGSYVTNDGQKLTLQPHQVTNDLRIARRVAGADAQAQAAIARQLSARASAAPAAQPQAISSIVSGSFPPEVETPAPTAPSTSLGTSSAIGQRHSKNAIFDPKR